MKKAIVLVSGGLDSATILAMVHNMGYAIYALSFHYGQRHNIEIVKATELAKIYNAIEHKLINIDLNTFGNSALTDSKLSVPKYQSASDLKDDIPITYVPARNTIFLSYALAFAETRKVCDIFLGVHAEDYANYPDCRPEYIKSFEVMANLATAFGLKNKITIHTPIINMNKSEIIREGIKLNVDYSKTISCYSPSEDGASCGSCHACLIRLNGFKENNLPDPIKYVN